MHQGAALGFLEQFAPIGAMYDPHGDRQRPQTKLSTLATYGSERSLGELNVSLSGDAIRHILKFEYHPEC
jgi:hypothetical protein